jgi:hypothetical protein
MRVEFQTEVWHVLSDDRGAKTQGSGDSSPYASITMRASSPAAAAW